MCFQFQEIENLQVLEEVSLSTDLSQGYALRALTGKHNPSQCARTQYTCKDLAENMILLFYFDEMAASKKCIHVYSDAL